MVVTGSAAGGVKKIEASYNIVTANAEQIKQANPKSTADLLKISPGMWPESTGGQTGANIEIAGFPGGGDAPYFSTLLMGSPVYGMPTLSFFETTTLMRLDDTIESVEILQGGPSVVFADGQMGATANFFLKTGTEEPTGSVGVTYGDEGLYRLDGFAGFKVAEGWYGSVGGFWRTSDGVRSPGFKADEGGQLTATLAHDFDKGSMVLYARYLNDKNQFITPIPLIQTGSDSFSEYPGFDPLTDTYYSRAIQHVRLPNYPGGPKDADLADGRGADMIFVGGNFDFSFDNGWSISDKFLFNDGDVDTNALFSGNNPATLNDMIYTPGTPGGFTSTGVSPTNPTPGTAVATYVGGGAVPLDQSVIQQGWWHIHKHLKSFNNDFRLSKELFEGNTLTIGFYINHYTMDDRWSLGNQMLMSNTPNATPITVNYVGMDGQTYQRTDSQGFADFGGFHIAQHGSATNMALYLSDSWRVGNWLLDLSGRLENQDATNNVCNRSAVNPGAGGLDGDPNTLYDNNVEMCNGTYAKTEYKKSHPAFTAGANYSFNDHMSMYGRVNTGGHFLDFDNGIRGSTTGNTPPIQKIRNYEIGFKYQSDLLYADISAYRRVFSGLQYQPTDGAGTPVGTPLIYGSDSVGVNFIGALHSDRESASAVGRQLSRRRVHRLQCLLPVHRYQRSARLRTDRRPAAATPAQGALHVHAQLQVRVRLGRHHAVRHLYPCRRPHAGPVRPAAAGFVPHCGLRRDLQRRRELAVQSARHQHDQRAGPDREQFAHLRLGRQRGWRVAGASDGRPRSQLPGQVQLVSLRG